MHCNKQQNKNQMPNECSNEKPMPKTLHNEILRQKKTKTNNRQ